MARKRDIAEQIARVLTREADFDADLVERDYRFAHRQKIPLAGFAYRPLDARSACIGVVTAAASSSDISDYRGLGAPLLLVESDDTFDLWRVGPTAERDHKVVGDLSVDGIGRYFRNKPKVLRPQRIYEAKTVARVEPTSKQLDLFSEFIDPDLLPFVEGRSGERLTATVVDSIRSLVEDFGPEEWVIKAVFRLMAGKILRDKSVPGFKSITLSDVTNVLKKVERHYGSRDALRLNKRKVSSLENVMADVQQLGDLRNLTTESLGDVYERALITKDIRKIHGTHKTPGYLVDYVVWQLAKWIEEIPVADLQFFEPGCGHAPFLVSLMRLLRTLNIDVADLSPFFRERFVGVDNDPFALEIARLSLTLADEPNPDGWHGLTEADMYAVGFLEEAAAKSTVMLTNPPYESRKEEELLFRTLPNLPVGAVFGAVVPATLLFSEKKRSVQLRKWMTSNCQLSEIDLFPDGLFTFGDHECAVIIGRVLDHDDARLPLQSRLRRVRDNEVARTEFKLDYRFTSSRTLSQNVFTIESENTLWVAEFDREIWSFLGRNDKLADIASASTGIDYKPIEGDSSVRTIAKKRFRGSRLGYVTSAGNWFVHGQPSPKYMSLDKGVIGRFRSGADCIPQVLLNYHPPSRGAWRLKPFIDEVGSPFTSSFLSIRPNSDTPLEFLFAILLSPVANLFVATHLLKRNHRPSVIGKIPLPFATTEDVGRVKKLVETYVSLAQKEQRDMFNTEGFTQHGLADSLLAIDAEILRMYSLPANSERILLECFRGEPRPGIPIAFNEFLPAETPGIPLYAFRSRSYQRALAGKSPSVPDRENSRYLALLEKRTTGTLTAREVERLHALQAEIDGRDYAIRYVGNATAPAPEAPVPSEFEQRLRALSDRAASAALKNGKQ